ncbi:MAG: hypothetical protein N2Z23_03305 [Pyrinomonadaceae bacterium]|nr:hypothetical protein [Pyrinomonadaceae bacterium]MCX7639454.1 hypothetical protein [Pyrinomonadaceae bacterium]MDW8304495.1 hypothetical protein [Acidobacteriota bacterium]
MLLRSVALSLALILSMGTLIQFSTDYSEAGPKVYQKKKKKKKKLRKYSKAWWKWYRAKLKRQQILAARKKALKARQARLARLKNSYRPGKPVETKAQLTFAYLPTGDPIPRGWRPAGSNSKEVQFFVDDEGGKFLGLASISLIGPAAPQNENMWGKNKSLSGVSLSALRRVVIDKMMREQGWVVNDYQKEVGGRRVFVVVAQSPGPDGKTLQRLFYFTEVDGKIYSLATNASSETADKIAEQTEKVLASFGRGFRSNERAELR